MKKFFYAMLAMASVFTSCNNDFEETDSIITSGESKVTITLEDTPDTRAFFDNTATAETWEKSLSSLTILAFDSSNNLIIRRNLTSSELTAKSVTFALPKSSAGTTCSFYGVANLDVSAITTKTALTGLLESEAAAYNGTFADVSTKAKRTAGFVMSGVTTKAVGAVNTTTQVGIILKRTVAKVAIQTSIDNSFANKYPGTLKINSVKLSKAASQSLVVAGTPSTGTMNYTHTQTSTVASSKYNNLFYIYENGNLSAGNRVTLEINATYTNGSTNSDVTYNVELTGASAGNILRNGYYRVNANITGLAGQECTVAITVAEWETPVTQSVNLGI